MLFNFKHCFLFSNVQILVQKYEANGTCVVKAKGIAAIHYASGMEEYDFGRQVVELILEQNTKSKYGSSLLVCCTI